MPKLLKWTAGGLLLGIVMVLPSTFGVHLPNSVMAILNVINAPALWMARTWSYDLMLPPSGEFGVWLVVPFASVVVQWSVLGLLIGLVMSCKLKHRDS